MYVFPVLPFGIVWYMATPLTSVNITSFFGLCKFFNIFRVFFVFDDIYIMYKPKSGSRALFERLSVGVDGFWHGGATQYEPSREGLL